MGQGRDAELARYERDYLQRLGSDGTPITEDEKYVESVRKEHAEGELTRDDRLVLEMIHRNERVALLGVGTMRLTKSALRLYCRGLVGVEDAGSLSFDERECLQAFLDSPPAKRYAGNLAKVARKEDRQFFKAAADIMGASDGGWGGGGLPSVVRATAEGEKLLSGAEPPYDYGEERAKYAGTALALYGGGADNSGREFAMMYGPGLLVGGVLTGSVIGGMGSG